MPVNPPISDEQRDRIVALARDETPRNQIARELGVSAGTVTKYVKRAGLQFDRAGTAKATEAAQKDDAARRERLTARILDKLDAILDEIDRMPVRNVTDVDKLARATAAVSRSYGEMTKASPLKGYDPHVEIRDAIQAFHASLDRNFGPDDSYGRLADRDHVAEEL